MFCGIYYKVTELSVAWLHGIIISIYGLDQIYAFQGEFLGLSRFKELSSLGFINSNSGHISELYECVDLTL